MPLQATSGAASYDGFGGGVAAVPNYIEDVFSTYLYTGNASTQTITNNIDLSTKGGMVWIKNRLLGGINNALQDTVRGGSNILFSNDTVGNQAYSTSITSFNTTGFTLGSENLTNQNSQSFVSWTFRKQPKFFDIVTYTGNAATTRQISHNLGSVPGCIFIKATSGSSNWFTYHRGNGTTTYTAFELNSTSDSTAAAATTPTSTYFDVQSILDSSYSYANNNGVTYVAYLFAHNAGGFGLNGTDNVISCGSYTGTGAVGNKITLGYEPQLLLIKRTNTANSWYLFDNMRGLSLSQSLALLPNGTNSELAYGTSFQLNADGFTQNNVNAAFNANGGTYIYIAIRRGPMKVPTDATKVFAPVAFTGTNTTTVINAGFPMDMVLIQARNTNAVLGGGAYDLDRLRGNVNRLFIPSTSAESASLGSPYDTFDNMTGLGADGTFFNNSAINYSDWFFRRAPSFFDEVCYTGNSTAGRAINHNLGVAPELMIVKNRTTSAGWAVASTAIGVNNNVFLQYNGAAADYGATYFYNTNPTSSVFYVGNDLLVNSGSTQNYVAYLFATCAGVSKVGSYTGTGTTKQIDCGFTGGARFVLIKRTDSTGDWYVWDTARGIVSGNDPYLLLNSTAAEVTTTDYIDTYSAGFEISSTAPAAINANGGTYIFLAIA